MVLKKRLHTLSFSLHPPHQRDSKVDNDDDNVDDDSVDDDDICGDKEDEEEDNHDGDPAGDTHLDHIKPGLVHLHIRCYFTARFHLFGLTLYPG